MMKIAEVALWSVAGAVGFLATGCVDLAQVNYGPDELRWQQALRESYSGYRPPRTPPPAGLKTGADTQDITPEVNATPAAADDDPNQVVDQAAESEFPTLQESPSAPAPDGGAGTVAPTKCEAQPVADNQAPPDKKVGAVKKGEPLDPTMAKNVYVVKPGDDLSRIAKKFYGNANCYDPIVKANSDLISNPNKLRPGMKLIIPAL